MIWWSLVLGLAVLFGVRRCFGPKHGPGLREWRNPYMATESENSLKLVRFILFAVGTRGDVQPMIAIANELKKRAHAVCICAPECFKDLVASYGVDFVSCGLESLDDQEAGWLRAKTESEFLGVVANTYLPFYGKMGTALRDLCLSFRADMVLTGVYGLHIALDVAEKTKTKVRCIKYMPEGVSRFQAPFGVVPAWNHPYCILWLHVRRLFRMFLAARRHGLTRVQNAFRTRELGIPNVSAERLESGGKYLPIAFAFSPSLVKRPSDWAPWHRVVGFIFADAPSATTLPSELETFLSAGARPVMVTFGSMRSLETAGCKLTERCVAACLKLGLRVVLVASDPVNLPFPLDKGSFFRVKQVPHELLLPHCCLAIHHGGAGTTARVAQAGVPSVVVPILQWLDQKGWALAVQEFGAGVCIPSPFATEEELAQTVAMVVQDPVKKLVFRARARDLQRRLDSEGSAAVAVVDWLLEPMANYQIDSGAYRDNALDRMALRACIFSEPLVT